MRAPRLRPTVDTVSADGDRALMRASDGDRQQVAQRLQSALDEGRLGLTEYDERLRDTYAARTYAELDEVTADLPAQVGPVHSTGGSEPGHRSAIEKQTARSGWWDEWKSWLGGALIMIAIWGGTSIASADLQPFWPAIPLGIWAAVLLASAIGGRDH